jgi:hypothetical protein
MHQVLGVQFLDDPKLYVAAARVAYAMIAP